jgi:hypothetical protein
VLVCTAEGPGIFESRRKVVGFWVESPNLLARLLGSSTQKQQADGDLSEMSENRVEVIWYDWWVLKVAIRKAKGKKSVQSWRVWQRSGRG